MSFMFKRYSPPARRAIFYAREAALSAGATEIDSTHLLCALALEKSSCANRLFKLDERFPEEVAQMRVLKRAAGQKDLPLNRDSKRILAYAAEEANGLDDYWIDTDHLVLGILREHTCAAAAKLDSVGIKIEEGRRQVAAFCEQRESYGAVPALWRLAKPITRVGHFAGIMYLLLIVGLIGILSAHGC
jgi:ATP-dependent Clp protease ATP-binding subunit ClpC